MVVSLYHSGENQMNDYETYEVRVYKNGNKTWLQNDEYHRTDGPAIEYANGDKTWYVNGKLHREDGPAVEEISGYKSWWKNGARHRTDGPAIEYANGENSWWQNDKLHRTDGPAIEWSDGTKFWYIDGVPYAEKEFKKKMNSCDGKTVTVDGKEYRLTAI